MRKSIITAAIVAGSLIAGSVGTVAAEAAMQPTYSHSVTTVTIYSPTCLQRVTDEVRYYKWSSADGQYVQLVRPTTTHRVSYTCHK